MIIKVNGDNYLGIPLYRCTLCLSQNRGKKSKISHTIGCKYKSKSKTKKKNYKRRNNKKTKKLRK